MIKRLFDLLVSGALVLVLWPVMLIIAAAIYRADPGPIFYRGVRAGRFGRPFQMLKFRTMVVGADKIGGPSTSDDDPRVTPVGSWLRRYKLDELPQLFNVLGGTMSIVGPRPEVLSEVALYTSEEQRLLAVRPGITDYASLTFHNEGEILKGSVDPHEAYLRLIRPEKMRLALQYARNPTLTADLRIIAATAGTLLRSRARRS